MLGANILHSNVVDNRGDAQVGVALEKAIERATQDYQQKIRRQGETSQNGGDGHYPGSVCAPLGHEMPHEAARF